MSEYGEILWRFAFARTRSRETAEDVMQETLLAAMQGYHRFAGASSELTWLLGIAANRIADRARRVRRERRSLGGGSPDETEPMGVESPAAPDFDERGRWISPPTDWGFAPASPAARAELLGVLAKCLERLPPGLADVVWLCELFGMPTGEVCKVLNLTATNLWTRLHRARSALRVCVEKDGRPRRDTRA